MKQLLSYTIIWLTTSNLLWAQTPPATWQEHWFEHNQLLSRVFFDNDVAIYYDNDVSRSITWPNSYMGDVWRYTKSVYGNFGSDPHLFAIFHTNKYSGGHPSTYFDASHDNRNVIDVGPGPWTSGGTGGDLDIATHEVAHIVEGASKGIHGSPAFGIWGDSKWAEIFIYDVYKGLGKTNEANRWFNQMQNSTDNFPRANTHWFRDWFYPIYNSYGGTAVLNRFFTLLAQYFPKSGNSYSRGMNWGEFVHFWSGAAGVNLKSLATTAFGWPAEYETQFNQARIDFPFTYGGVVTVYKDCNYGGYAVSLNAGSYTLSQLQALGVVNDDISSLKVQSGYRVTLYWDNNFQGSTLVKTADDACLVDDGWNDKVSSLVIAAAAPVAQSQRALADQLIDQSVQGSQSFQVYPVPAQQQLNISTNEDLTGGIISVFDITGKQVIAARAAARRIDVSKLTPGVYMLIYSKNGQVTKKQFIKQ
jgi:hypothetical protein